MNSLLSLSTPIPLTLLLLLVCWPGSAEGPQRALPESPPDRSEADPGQLISAALASLPAEPSLESLEDAALHYLDAHPEAVARWLSAPRRAALLPEVRLVADFDQERDESLDRYQDDPDRWGADTDKDLGFQLSLTWRLSHLIYSPDQARTHSVLVDRAQRREGVLTTLIRAYYERRKLQVRLLVAPPGDPMAYLDLASRRDELTSLINALTGGVLQRHTSGNSGDLRRP